MDTNRIRVTKTRRIETHLGCQVLRKSTFNAKTGCVDEDIVLSHPRPIYAVAFSSEDTLDREARRR